MSCFLRQNGRLSKELDLVSHNVRTRLDELKRQEVSRLRMLLKAKLDSTNTQSESTHRPELQTERWCLFLLTVYLGKSGEMMSSHCWNREKQYR